MEIHLKKKEGEQENYTLVAVLDFEEYHCDIISENFESDIIEIECLPDAIIEGFSKISALKKLDENLSIETIFTFSEDKDIMYVNMDLVHKKGSRLKSTKEKHEFELKKQIQSSICKMGRIVQEFSKADIVHENAKNFYVTILTDKKVVYIKKNINKLPNTDYEKQYIIGPNYELEQNFFKYISENMAKCLPEKKVTVDKHLIDNYFQSPKIYEIILNYLTQLHFINFFKVFNKGRKILFSINPTRLSVRRNFTVTEFAYRYFFKNGQKYTILQEFAVEKKQSGYASRIEIILSGDHYLILENGHIAKNKILHLKNHLNIETNEVGLLHKIYVSGPQSTSGPQVAESSIQPGESSRYGIKFTGQIESPSSLLMLKFYENNLILLNLNTPNLDPLLPGVSYIFQIKHGNIEEKYFTIIENHF